MLGFQIIDEYNGQRLQHGLDNTNSAKVGGGSATTNILAHGFMVVKPSEN